MSTQSNKRTYILLGILVLCGAVWYATLPPSQEELDVAIEQQGVVGAEASVLLAEIQSINLDFSILEKPEFTSLINRNQPDLNLPVGKSNPFQ